MGKKATKVSTESKDKSASVLIQNALYFIANGLWDEAANLLEKAAMWNHRQSQDYDEARCLQLAATLRRSAGSVDKAQVLINRAAKISHQDVPLTVSIFCEQAETAYGSGEFEDAVMFWNKALEQALNAHLKVDGLSAILRRRAFVYVFLSQIDEAFLDFDQAFHLLLTKYDVQFALWVRVEQASLLLQQGYINAASQVLDELEDTLDETDVDSHFMAELMTLYAQRAFFVQDADVAIAHAQRARNAALRAVEPLSYFKASVTLAEAVNLKFDYVNSYRILATTWITLSDVIGKETAQTWVEPCLQAIQLRWGLTAFRNVKAEYEKQRKEEIGLRNKMQEEN